MGFYDSPLWREFSMGHPGGEESTRWLLSHVPPGGRLLDLCCGLGDSSAVAGSLGLDVTGIDMGSVLKHAGEKHPDLHLIRWEGGLLPFADDCFDAVLCECSLSLMENRDAVLSELRRVLRDDGVFLVSDIYDGNAAPLIPGFRCIAYEDRTGDLKEFAVRWLWETGKPFPGDYGSSRYFAAAYVFERDVF